jgi:hypothetical protein
MDWLVYVLEECDIAAAKRRERVLLDEILPMSEGRGKIAAIEGWKKSGSRVSTTLPALDALLVYEGDPPIGVCL